MQQHGHYLRTVQALGGLGQILKWGDGATAQVITRRIGPLRLNWMARGPCWPACADKPRALALLLCDTPGAVLAIPDCADDIAGFRQAGFRALMPARAVAEIDLTLSREDRLAAQHGKWRNRLRQSARAAMVLHDQPFDPLCHAPLLTLEEDQRRRRRYAALPTRFTLAWARSNPAATRIFLAYGRGAEPIAFVLVLLHAPSASYHIGWTGAEGRKRSAHNRLLWEASNWLAAQGYRRFDLGWVDASANPGLTRFKTGFGASTRAIGPLMWRLPAPFRRN